MAAMEKQKDGFGAGEAIRKLRLLDGLQVGIKNLDAILREVAELKLTDNQSLKTELLGRVKTCNYVPYGAEHEYSAVLLREYQRIFDPASFKDQGITERHRYTKG